MTETPEPHTESPQESRAVEEVQRDGRYDRTNRLNQALTWVGIIAGVAFVVALVFFSGFFLGGYSQGGYGNHPQPGPGGSMGHGCKMGSGGMGPGGMGPG